MRGRGEHRTREQQELDDDLLLLLRILLFLLLSPLLSRWLLWWWYWWCFYYFSSWTSGVFVLIYIVIFSNGCVKLVKHNRLEQKSSQLVISMEKIALSNGHSCYEKVRLLLLRYVSPDQHTQHSPTYTENRQCFLGVTSKLLLAHMSLPPCCYARLAQPQPPLQWLY